MQMSKMLWSAMTGVSARAKKRLHSRGRMRERKRKEEKRKEAERGRETVGKRAVRE